MSQKHQYNYHTSSPAERSVEIARTYCEQLDNMPEAVGYLPAPKAKRRGRVLGSTPETLRSTIEQDICDCAAEGHHEALAVYRDHGVTLSIFERYDSFLDDYNLYGYSPEAILNGKVKFPNPLKPLGIAMLGYGDKRLSQLPRTPMSEHDFVQTMNVLSSMGGRLYLTEPQYVAKMFNDMNSSAFIPNKDHDRMVVAMKHFLDKGGVSLCRPEKTDPPLDDQIEKCFDAIRRISKKIPSYNPILNISMDADALSGHREFNQYLVFSRFLSALKNGQPHEVSHLAKISEISETFARMHELSQLKKTASQITLERKAYFTPLRMIGVIDQCPRGDDTLTERLFQVAIDAGVMAFTKDLGHMISFLKHYNQEGSLHITSHGGFNHELEKVIHELGFDAAVELARDFDFSTRSTAIARAKDLIDNSKASVLEQASETTINTLFRTSNGEDLRKKLGLEIGDAFFNKGKTTRSMSFRADAFSSDLGL